MSLIGPRPDPLDDMDIYTEHQKRKLEVKPGITGYNQAYFRNSVEQNEKFENDVYYAEHVSFILDAKIFFKTIVMVLSHNSVCHFPAYVLYFICFTNATSITKTLF